MTKLFDFNKIHKNASLESDLIDTYNSEW